MVEVLSKEEKLKILKSLEEDMEFKYAIAGFVGVSDVMKRLDRLEENQQKLWENANRLWDEVKHLGETQNAILETQNTMLKTQNTMLKTLSRLSVTVERLAISVEEEARDVIRHRLREELGIDVPLDVAWVDGEINLYGVAGDVCVVGEAAVRLSIGLIEELERKVELLRGARPDLLRPRLIKVVYADYAVPAALEYAKNRGIWILKWSGDLTPRIMHEIKV